jgi:branched-chain amino acid transport system substrate-binding protein
MPSRQNREYVVKFKTFAWCVAAMMFGASQTLAQQPVKIGFITTLSGPGGYLGQDIRDAFQLRIKEEGGTLGGVPVELLIEDDGLKPGQAKQIAERFMKSEGVKLFTGIVFSNVAGAVVPDVVDNGGIFVSANAGPSNFAGKECHKNYFVMSWLTDTMQGSAGQNATALGYKRAFVLAPNYTAGKDAIEGFKRFFKGEIIGEVYTRLDQTDFASEMAQIRAAKPDVVFHFHPGGLGIAFMRQYQQAGLLGAIPMVLAEPSMDHVLLKTIGDAALGTDVSGAWNTDFVNPVNKKFVEDFTKAYGRTPTMYAAQGYDTAIAIGAALKAVGGKVENTDGFRTAMLKADYALTRGPFKFGPNQHPVQDWYAMKVEKDATGTIVLRTREKILTGYGDPYAKDCKL